MFLGISSITVRTKTQAQVGWFHHSREVSIQLARRELANTLLALYRNHFLSFLHEYEETSAHGLSVNHREPKIFQHAKIKIRHRRDEDG
jgi:hypothetical protein